MKDDEKLVKVRVELPNHPRVGGESMWARPLGDDRYEVRNTPFFAYGLNFHDVVEAIEDPPGTKPLIRRVSQPGGHRTIRVMFTDEAPARQRGLLLESLNRFRAFYENADGTMFAVDVEPQGDYEAVLNQLDEWASAGLLEYETCEARLSGSFGCAPARRPQ
jgi:hypothetical protein